MLSPYSHLAIRRFPHFAWVAIGSEDWAAEAAEAAGFAALSNPDRGAVSVALEVAGDRELVIVRKTPSFYAARDGLASPGRALVDLRFEVTRDRHPLSGAELLRIAYYLLGSHSMDFPKMLRSAGLRRRAPEIRWLLGQFKGRADIPGARTEGGRPGKFARRLPKLDEALGR